MGAAVKKTISLPAKLARDAEALAKAQGKSLSAVIQDVLRDARIDRRLQELRGVQGYWSRTNVLVSALVFPGGRAWDELLGVLSRKFARDAEELARVAIFLADIGAMV